MVQEYKIYSKLFVNKIEHVQVHVTYIQTSHKTQLLKICINYKIQNTKRKMQTKINLVKVKKSKCKPKIDNKSYHMNNNI